MTIAEIDYNAVYSADIDDDKVLGSFGWLEAPFA